MCCGLRSRNLYQRHLADGPQTTPPHPHDHAAHADGRAHRGNASTELALRGSQTIVVEGQELRDQLDQLGWLAHARAAGQRKPSPITQAEVIATYERRALANKAPKPAVLTTCWERFENREGFASTKKLWLLLPGTGDGERRLLGLVDEVSELDAIETARRCGFEAQVSL